MAEDWPDEEGYPDEHTRTILKWCECVDEIVEGDDETLPRLVRESPTKTLIAVFGHYDDLLTDAERDAANGFSDWDQEVMSSVQLELRNRGVVAIRAHLAEMLDPVTDALAQRSTKH